MLSFFFFFLKTDASQRFDLQYMENGDSIAVLHFNIFTCVDTFWSLSKHMQAVCTENTIWSKSESLNDCLLLPVLLLTGSLPSGDILQAPA